MFDFRVNLVTGPLKVVFKRRWKCELYTDEKMRRFYKVSCELSRLKMPLVVTLLVIAEILFHPGRVKIQ